MYLSGMESKNKKKTDSSFTFDAINSLEMQATKKPMIDILITSQWPSAVNNFAVKPVSDFNFLF